MQATARKAELKDIQPLRALFLEETNFQIRYDACHERGWTPMLYESSDAAGSDIVLFEDHAVTGHVIPGAIFRPRRADDRVFEHGIEPVGDYVVELSGEVIATGGFLLHYNRPFADLYMEVREDCRGRGVGSFLLQEIKKECYLAGRVPAAGCDLLNAASRATLIKAGLRVCGFLLAGKVKRR